MRLGRFILFVWSLLLIGLGSMVSIKRKTKKNNRRIKMKVIKSVLIFVLLATVGQYTNAQLFKKKVQEVEKVYACDTLEYQDVESQKDYLVKRKSIGTKTIFWWGTDIKGGVKITVVTKDYYVIREDWMDRDLDISKSVIRYGKTYKDKYGKAYLPTNLEYIKRGTKVIVGVINAKLSDYPDGPDYTYKWDQTLRKNLKDITPVMDAAWEITGEGKADFPSLE